MRSSKLLSALLLVGTLTLAAPGVASAHAEGRANCRFATQQNIAFNLASLGRAQQTYAGVVTGIVSTVEELDRSIDRAVGAAARQAEAVAAGLVRAVGATADRARTTIGLGTWGGARLHVPR